MAKLNVQVLDAKDGVIERVRWQGRNYVRVTDVQQDNNGKVYVVSRGGALSLNNVNGVVISSDEYRVLTPYHEPVKQAGKPVNARKPIADPTHGDVVTVGDTYISDEHNGYAYPHQPEKAARPLRPGDIARVTNSCGAPVPVGTLVEVFIGNGGGYFTDEKGWAMTGELVCAAENRADRKC